LGNPARDRPVTMLKYNFCTKRLIGRTFEDPSVKKDIERAPFKIVNQIKK
jgi:molecular chaperone DnaK